MRMEKCVPFHIVSVPVAARIDILKDTSKDTCTESQKE